MGYCERVMLFKACIAEQMLSDESDARRFRRNSIVRHRTFKDKSNYVSCFSTIGKDGVEKYYISDDSKKGYRQIDINDFIRLAYSEDSLVYGKGIANTHVNYEK